MNTVSKNGKLDYKCIILSSHISNVLVIPFKEHYNIYKVRQSGAEDFIKHSVRVRASSSDWDVGLAECFAVFTGQASSL